MSNDQRKISHLSAQSQSSSTSVFSADAGLTRIMSDGKIWRTGALSSDWKLMLASSFRGVAGGSHSNVSFEDVHLDLPDTLTPLFQKLDVRTHTHTHN